MARVGFSVGGFNGNLMDYAPFAYTYTEGAPDDVSTYHPVSIDFDLFFALYCKRRSIRVYGEFSSSGGPFDFEMPAYQWTDTSDPTNDIPGASDESEIAEKCNQFWLYAFFGSGQFVELKLNDCGFDTSTSEFSPWFRISTNASGVLTHTNISGLPLMQPSAATCSFFGISVPLFEYVASPNTGAIVIEAPATNGYWTYDGIWDANTGAQRIRPVPRGL